MGKSNPTITFTVVEWTLLAALLGIDRLLGLPDPSEGRFAHELEQDLLAARKSLTRRNMIRLNQEGRVEVDGAIALLAGVCAFPERCVIMTRSRHGQAPAVRHLFIRPGLAAEQMVVKESVRLTAIEGPEAAEAHVLRYLGLLRRPVSEVADRLGPEHGAVLAQELLEQAGAAPGGASAFLQQAGLPEPIAQGLAAALADPVVNAGLTVMEPCNGEWEVAGLGLLEGRGSMWLLHPSADDRVEVTPCGGAAAAAAVKRLVEGGRTV